MFLSSKDHSLIGLIIALFSRDVNKNVKKKEKFFHFVKKQAGAPPADKHQFIFPLSPACAGALPEGEPIL